MAQLIQETDGTRYVKETQVEEQPEALRGLLNDTRWKILQHIAEKPSYPAAIADELDINDQNVYYHIREMRDSGIIEVASREERGGSLAKYYQPTAQAYALDLPGEGKPADMPISGTSSPVRDFLHPFISNGTIDCRIIVGSPDPHGPHQVRGRDGHYAVDIGALLGRHGSIEREVAELDTEVKNEDAYDDNLVLVGGPLTNTITAEFNSYLPVRFDQENFPYRRLLSDQTGEEYSDDSIGLIAKARNPKNQDHFIIVIAGIRNTGTTAAVLGLTEHADDILDDYENEDTWARVVRGRDMDSDGKIDEVEVVE
ncbi:MAG: S-layer protein [Candidatus Nanohaloarchaea archaeon]|nr:S-layer protein [Candidatus Nanohaloarchaea archaeon]